MALTRTAPRQRAAFAGWGVWSWVVLLVAAVVAAPVIAVTVDALAGGRTRNLPRGLGGMVLTTVVLLLGVALGTLVVGGGLAWLVTAYRFPLRGVLSWLLVLPLAMPAYILGFVFLSTFDVGGPVHGWLRSTLGPDAWVPDVRSLPACIVVMSLTLYPYVYLRVRAALLEQAPSTYDAARTLGAGRLRTFRTVVLPLARPSLAAGVAPVMMEVLTDFATVQYFGVRTVSVGVYLTWKGSYDFQSATQLSMLVLAFAVAVLAGERLMRGRARFTQKGGRGRGLEAVRLSGVRGWAATMTCLLALFAAFLLPVVRLLVWAVEEARVDMSSLVDARFGEYLANTLTVAVLAAVGCVGLAFLLGHSLRLTAERLPRAAAQLTTLGYAVPGAVVGIGGLLTSHMSIEEHSQSMAVSVARTGWPPKPERRPRPAGTVSLRECPREYDLVSRYVRNSLTWVSLDHLCHNRDRPWTDTDQWAFEDCSEDADYYRGEILRLPDELFVKVVAILCTYAAHLTDVLDTHIHEDPSLTMPTTDTPNSITSPNHFHVLSTLIGNPEAGRNTLIRLLDTAMGQVDALGRFAERMPSNPVDAALYELDVAYGVSG